MRNPTAQSFAGSLRSYSRSRPGAAAAYLHALERPATRSTPCERSFRRCVCAQSLEPDLARARRIAHARRLAAGQRPRCSIAAGCRSTHRRRSPLASSVSAPASRAVRRAPTPRAPARRPHPSSSPRRSRHSTCDPLWEDAMGPDRSGVSRGAQRCSRWPRFFRRISAGRPRREKSKISVLQARARRHQERARLRPQTQRSRRRRSALTSSSQQVGDRAPRAPRDAAAGAARRAARHRAGERRQPGDQLRGRRAGRDRIRRATTARGFAARDRRAVHLGADRPVPARLRQHQRHDGRGRSTSRRRRWSRPRCRTT